MKIVWLARVSLALGIASLIALVVASAVYISRLRAEERQFTELLSIQQEISAMSVGADTIALSGADPVLYEAYVEHAREVQSKLRELGAGFPDAGNAARAIDMLLADLDNLVERGGVTSIAGFGPNGRDGSPAYLLLSNIANHGIAVDAAVGEALLSRQRQISNDALSVATSFASLASFLLLAAVGGFALIYRSIGLPLRDFTRTIRAVEGGAMDARAPENRTDEIGDMARAFNSLVAHRQQAEAELARNASLLRIAGEMAQFGGWRFDALENKLEWSDETAAIHDEPAGKAPGVDEGINYYVPEDRARITRQFGACLEDGTPFDDVFRIETARGRMLWVRSVGEPLRDDEGRIVGAHGAFQDISDLVEARTEAERRNAELQEVVSSIGDGFFTIDRDWKFTYHNEEALELIGRPGEDLIGHDLWDEFPEARGTAFEYWYTKVLETGESQSFVEFFEPLDRWYQVSAHPTRDGLAAYFRDYTAEQKKQEQLRLLQAAMDRTNDIILITEADLLDAPDHPRTLYVNAAFEQKTGYTREEALASTPRILQGPETQREELEKIRQALEVGRPVRAELINYTKSGRPFWLELDISPVEDGNGWYTHWVAVQRDITARKVQEERLRTSEERFRLLSEASSDVMVDLDVSSGRYWVSENYKSVIGEIAGDPPDVRTDLLARAHEDDRAATEASFERALKGTARTWQAEFRLRRDSGKMGVFVVRANIIRDENRRATRVVGGLTDVTELRELDSRLHEAQKLEAVGALTGGVAHDFNNLLTIIMGNAEALTESSDDQVVRMASATLDAAERGAALTQNLLAFARRQPLSPASVDVNELIRDTYPLVRHGVQEGIAVEFDLDAEEPTALIDPNKLQSAILNLAINSQHAIGEHGTITIETENVTLDERYAETHAEVTPGDYIVIAVSDNGSGMSRDVMEHAFEPFFTTKPTGTGTGLGLSMVYGYVKQSGGHVTVYSEEGVGTTVRLYLPATSHAETVPGVEAAEEMPAGDGTHVLVVEDDDALRANVVDQISKLGYRVSSAGDGTAALEALAANPDITLLFTDMVMPGAYKGSQLAKEAKRRRPDLKVLFTSGYTPHAISGNGDFGTGSIEMLSKPYRIAELAHALYRAIHNGVD